MRVDGLGVEAFEVEVSVHRVRRRIAPRKKRFAPVRRAVCSAMEFRFGRKPHPRPAPHMPPLGRAKRTPATSAATATLRTRRAEAIRLRARPKTQAPGRRLERNAANRRWLPDTLRSRMPERRRRTRRNSLSQPNATVSGSAPRRATPAATRCIGFVGRRVVVVLLGDTPFAGVVELVDDVEQASRDASVRARESCRRTDHGATRGFVGSTSFACRNASITRSSHARAKFAICARDGQSARPCARAVVDRTRVDAALEQFFKRASIGDCPARVR